MKKSFLILAAAAGMFAACTNDEAVLEQPVAQQGQTPVLFDAYAGRSVTRAGSTTDIADAAALQGITDGFGVFAYYTNNSNYDDNVSTPNFMYNQQVTYASSKWGYNPVKYWPNEYGTAAVSDETDKLTFFAYAPYVEVVPSTGKIDGDADLQTWGITGLTRNTAIGDPLVKYIVNFNAAKSVDLVWGTVDNATWNITNSGSAQDPALAVGKPWLNIERPASAEDQKIKFNFKHATSKLNVQIAYYADKNDNSSSETILPAETKIYVRSITFKGFATKGALNLNNTQPDVARWMSFNGTDDLETGETVTIYDGRKDGKEGVDGAIASNEKITGLNNQIIQGDAVTTGVTKDLQNLFTGADETSPIYVIPTGDPVEVEIVYDVETMDDNLAGVLSDGKSRGSSVENRIKKTITWASAETVLKNGKAYTLKLYLGMNSVKFDADVTSWSAADTNTSDLPKNQY